MPRLITPAPVPSNYVPRGPAASKPVWDPRRHSPTQVANFMSRTAELFTPAHPADLPQPRRARQSRITYNMDKGGKTSPTITIHHRRFRARASSPHFPTAQHDKRE